MWLAAIMRKRPPLALSLRAMLQSLSVTPFEKTPLSQLFPISHRIPNPDPANQLKLL
jgi:hypothetical protein